MACPQCCSGCGQMKAFVWIFWIVNTFFSSIYSGLSLATFSNIKSGTENFVFESDTQRNTYRNSLLASCMLGFLIVLFFMIFSFLVLIARTFGDVKLSYGIMLGTALHTAWFLLLAGLVLQNRDPDMQNLQNSNVWSSNDYKTYQATYAFCYILVAMYLIAFFVLFFGRKYIGKTEEEGGPVASGGSQPVNVYLDMGSMSQQKGSMTRNNQV